MAATERPDITLATLRNEPIDSALPKLPIEPIENAEFLEPIDITESVDAMDSRLLVERMLHFELSDALIVRGSLRGASRGCDVRSP